MPRSRASLWMILITLATVITLFLLPFTPRTAVHTVKVEQGDLLRTLTLEGAVGYRYQQICAALSAGVVETVYVQPGQQVQKGDLLFAMDVSAQMKMLASLSRSQYTRQQEAEWLAAWQSDAGTEWELRAQIEGGKVRADRDGVVRAVYVEQGDAVAAAGLLGVVSGEEKCVSALTYSQDVQGMQAGAAALLTTQAQSGAATLSALSAPEWNKGTAQSMQQLTFTPLHQDTLADAEVGDPVETELLVQCMEDVALIPIGAVDSQGRIWVVEEGQATPQVIDISQRNENYVAADQKLAGARLILQPDAYSLWAGCPVKEARRR